jgi:hypothetical protein
MKIESRELISHSLDRVQHLDRLSRIVLPERRHARILTPLAEYFLSRD